MRKYKGKKTYEELELMPLSVLNSFIRLNYQSSRLPTKIWLLFNKKMNEEEKNA